MTQDEIRELAIDKLRILAKTSVFQLNTAIKNVNELNKVAEELGYVIDSADGSLIELSKVN